jgi:hypothetical protein
MTTPVSKLALTGILFVAIFFFGFWLTRSGKPYGLLLFNVHKLIALGALVFLGVTVYQQRQLALADPLTVIILVLTAGCFIVSIVSGGLLNIDPPLPAFLLTLHRIFPFLTLLSTAASLYLLLGRGQTV